MIVMKFGGTSVADGEKILSVASLVKSFKSKKPIVVVSAMAGITDMLLDTARTAQKGNIDKVEESVEIIRKRHKKVVREVALSKKEKENLDKQVNQSLAELLEIYHGIILLKELSPRSLDMVSSFGERISVLLVSAALMKLGVPSYPIDARQFVRTDTTFGNAIVNLNVTKRLFRKHIFPQFKGKSVPVITGFIGHTKDKLTTTIGRNGTDYTATIVAYSCGLDCKEVWIWKDVDGVMTADPRLYPKAKVVPHLSFQEASEISYFGGGVIHPRTMQPAVLADIPIRFKNTFNPESPGTIISSENKYLNRYLITCSIDRLTLITVEGAGLQATPEAVVRVLRTVAVAGIHIYMISMSSSEYNISFLVRESDTTRVEDLLKKELHIMQIVEKSISKIVVEKGVSIIACVGANLKGRVGIAGRIFSILGKNNINIIAIAQGSSEYNISMVVDGKNMKKAVYCIQEELGKIS